MGWLGNLLGGVAKVAGPVVGTAIAPGIGTAIGGAVGNAVGGAAGGGGGAAGGGGHDTLQTILKAGAIGLPALLGLFGANSASKKQNANLALMQQIAQTQLDRQNEAYNAGAPIRSAAHSLLLERLKQRGLNLGVPAASYGGAGAAVTPMLARLQAAQRGVYGPEARTATQSSTLYNALRGG